ncbi:hypothetical protein [Bradyrhizobium sp. USDA 3458]|uniref:hypothetical protein n=1 Tax=Bradyrhizobium sp. USDA 3458 TaxID=2591461 RepID=UPI001141F36B|nr:hypothetical protein [Bradyrhizobium sp. USDA 3458]
MNTKKTCKISVRSSRWRRVRAIWRQTFPRVIGVANAGEAACLAKQWIWHLHRPGVLDLSEGHLLEYRSHLKFTHLTVMEK